MKDEWLARLVFRVHACDGQLKSALVWDHLVTGDIAFIRQSLCRANYHLFPKFREPQRVLRWLFEVERLNNITPSRSTLRQTENRSCDICIQRASAIKRGLKRTSYSRLVCEAMILMISRSRLFSSFARISTSTSESALLSPRAFDPKRMIWATCAPSSESG